MFSLLYHTHSVGVLTLNVLGVSPCLHYVMPAVLARSLRNSLHKERDVNLIYTAAINLPALNRTEQHCDKQPHYGETVIKFQRSDIGGVGRGQEQGGVV